MSSLDAIRVTVENQTGNVRPLLHEIRHALTRLVERGEPTCIDLRSLPIAPSEIDALEAALGRGEIEVELAAFGRSVIRECGISGVWIVEHYNADDELMTTHIEITSVPEILRSQPADIADGLQRLERQLKPGEPLEPVAAAPLTPAGQH